MRKPKNRPRLLKKRPNSRQYIYKYTDTCWRTFGLILEIAAPRSQQ